MRLTELSRSMGNTELQKNAFEKHEE